ncbi:hypothetical protein C1I89_29450 [Achromobacter pulmonis]|uniref:Uncharacterized protein n=1 Tax=Achromobacter pulmonis TaxID=1389932 RepID=A0A2N8KAM6_9BURK|nr:hypothetical protein [Achromobacter pulmonis]PND30506.1 hypothetical protein C1I89_29450 [Achromobacter pulmonis]
MEQVDHGLYDYRDQFDAWEAACLIAGYEPVGIDRGDPLHIPGRVKVLLSLMDDAYQTALYYCRVACNGGHIHEANGAPAKFDVSADPSSLPSAELREVYARTITEGRRDSAYTDTMLVTRNPMFRREDIEKWLGLIGWKEAHYFVTQEERQEKPLASRERETLLKLVISMAVVGYRYDSTGKRSGAVSEITKDVESLGLSVSDETVRKYLKEASGLLSGKPHKD